MQSENLKLAVVTGCFGFIGRHVTEKLLKKGWHVYGIDKCTYVADPTLEKHFTKKYGDYFTFSKEDICDIARIPDCDVIINIAAESHVGNSIISTSDFIKTNIIGTQNIIDIIKNKPKNVTRSPLLLHFSTDEVYGDIVDGDYTEDSLLNPSNPYSASKAAADLMIKAAARTHGIRYRIVRPANNYGSGQYHEKLIPLSVRLLSRGEKINLHDRGEPIREWLHVKDTASAVLCVLEKGKDNETYNVSSEFWQKNIITVKKIINSYFSGAHVTEYKRWKDHVDLEYRREGQDVRYAVSSKKIRKLGWKPKKAFDKEIDGLVKIFKADTTW